MEQILSIVVRNQPGVLMRVAGMFSAARLQYRQSGSRHYAKPRIFEDDCYHAG